MTLYVDQCLLLRWANAPVVAHGQPHKRGDVKILVVGRQRRQIQQVIVTLVPGGVRHLGQQVTRLTLPVAEVEVDRAEVKAHAAYIAEQQHSPVLLDCAPQLCHLVPHRLLEAPFAAFEIVFAMKGEQPGPLHAEPAPLTEVRQLVQIQPQHEEAVGEGVGPGCEAAMSHRALPDGADCLSHGDSTHSSAPKRLATSSALRTPSS